MGSQAKKTDSEGEVPGWVRFAKFLLLLCMAGLFFWLGLSMARHHFFTGGTQNNRGTTIGQ